MIFRLFVVVERRDAQFNFSFLTLLLQLSHSTSRLPSYSILDCMLSFFPYVPIFPRQLPTTTKKHVGVQNGGGGGDMSGQGA